MSGCAALIPILFPVMALHSTFTQFTLQKVLYISSVPLQNLLPHLALLNFVTNTLPKPVLISLVYRLTILQLASRIMPTIGADSWESAEGVDNGWDDRPVCYFYSFLCFLSPNRPQPSLVSFSPIDSSFSSLFIPICSVSRYLP